MADLILVLGDQLSPHLASLRGARRGDDRVLLAEVAEEATYVRHHPQKIAFLFAAMRHFARELERSRHDVRYVTLDQSGNTGSLRGEVERACRRQRFDAVVVTEPGEHRLAVEIAGWEEHLGLPVRVLPDDRFLCGRETFAAWIDGRKAPRMEHFYREMRRRHGVLMDDGEPCGGRWNFDADNREPLPEDFMPPERPAFRNDATTRAVLALVAERFADHPGSLDGFNWGVSRNQAERERDWFFGHALPRFGDYQDAMRTGAPFLFHSRLAAYLNCGLLDAADLCGRAEAAWRAGAAPLNAVEGFIRQVLGWREYVRGIYWHAMPDYRQRNFLDARRPLPDFYWTGDTDLNCLRQVIGETLANAYAHHIQRLMITGNFALLAGILPDAVNDWYLQVYADAYEWVQLPNTHGMALFADGGLLASKPYAAGGNYINRMSDYCSGCHYDVNRKTGPDACPFNYLYWDFLDRNRERLAGNPRLAMPYRTLARMDPERVDAIRASSRRFLESLDGRVARG